MLGTGERFLLGGAKVFGKRVTSRKGSTDVGAPGGILNCAGGKVTEKGGGRSTFSFLGGGVAAQCESEETII